MSAKRFAAVRSVETGSWLGLAHQGKGLGREMREAILPCHLAVGRYEENGEARGPRRDDSSRTVRFRMSREIWESRRRDDIEIDRLARFLEMFMGAEAGPRSRVRP